MKLIGGDWIDAHDNLAICGPSGVGKSWLACALGHKACRDDRSVLYQRVPRLFANLALAHGDGRYARLQRTLGHVQLLILDDWGLEPLNEQARHDLLEILEDRYGRRSTNRLATTFWRSSRIGTDAARQSLPVSFQYQPGMRSSAIQPMPMPSSIASFITPTA
ncbi:IstB-like ATP binding protein [Rhizobium tibeticum]|uniref:IstB-like ATP binding protein n=1 Tax=Rhizobium tibeticum TaxID=501024 RepID=A0ABY1AX91_9HYPH|nr:IstB-like ATP binding protein [Rhizobium tibeticum]